MLCKLLHQDSHFLASLNSVHFFELELFSMLLWFPPSLEDLYALQFSLAIIHQVNLADPQVNIKYLTKHLNKDYNS